MLYDSFEIVAAILSLVCMFVTLVCIVLDVKSNCIPTMVSIGGGILYAMFLELAKTSMNVIQRQAYSSLLLAFALFAIVAYVSYRETKQKKQKSEKKFKEFKRECFEARNGVLVIDA